MEGKHIPDWQRGETFDALGIKPRKHRPAPRKRGAEPDPLNPGLPFAFFITWQDGEPFRQGVVDTHDGNLIGGLFFDWLHGYPSARVTLSDAMIERSTFYMTDYDMRMDIERSSALKRKAA